MYCKLKEPYVLRGWEKLPHALQNLETGVTMFLDDVSWQALSFCNGRVDTDSLFLPPPFAKIIKKLIHNAVVEECAYGSGLTREQEYRLIPCRFIARAHWSITGKCNLRCRHCYMSAPEAKYGELPQEQCLDIIRQLADAGITQISLTGGEPLVRSDFLDLVNALVEHHIRIVQIYTNGVLVNKKLLDNLEERNCKPEFSLSFDGVGWHDWLRGTPGTEQIAIDAIRLLRSRGFEVSIETCLHKKNLHTLSETLELLTELGVRSWKTSPASDSGNWVREGGRYNLTSGELYDAYLDFIPEYKAAGSPLNLMLGGFFMNRKGTDTYMIPSKKYDGSEKSEGSVICGSARNNMYIAADGKILPCIPLSGLPIQGEMPSLLDTPLVEALSSSSYLERINTRLGDLLSTNEKCRECEHKYYCGGGCRAGALLTSNEYLGCDEFTCYLFKNGYETKIAAAYTGEPIRS